MPPKRLFVRNARKKFRFATIRQHMPPVPTTPLRSIAAAETFTRVAGGEAPGHSIRTFGKQLDLAGGRGETPDSPSPTATFSGAMATAMSGTALAFAVTLENEISPA